MIKISIIIPCYNVEKYIRECMESILSQTLHEIEIILVDDGSTDRTLQILESYQNKYDNVKILQQGNRGSGIARNQGIIAATGEYMAFMDADDFYPSSDTLEKVYITAIQKEALICGGSACIIYMNGGFISKNTNNMLTFSEDGWISKKDFPTSSGYWRFIYKSEFIKSNQIFFPEYLRCQDPPFFLEAVARAGQVYCIKEVTYMYRKGHKKVLYTQKKAIDLAKGIRDSLVISKREGMVAAYSQRLNMLHGIPSARMYHYAETCVEMENIIHQINETIGENLDSRSGISLLKEKEEISNYLKEVQEEKKQLLEELRQEKKVLIFGAGIIGKRVRAFLDRNEVVIEAFVVSDVTQNDLFVDGLQVKCIDDYLNVKNNCLVIISTSLALQKDIKEILRGKGFVKLYSLLPEKFYLFEDQVLI